MGGARVVGEVVGRVFNGYAAVREGMASIFYGAVVTDPDCGVWGKIIEK